MYKRTKKLQGKAEWIFNTKIRQLISSFIQFYKYQHFPLNCHPDELAIVMGIPQSRDYAGQFSTSDPRQQYVGENVGFPEESWW